MDSPTHQRLDERCDLRHLRSCRSKQTDPEHSSSQSSSVHSLSEYVCAVLLPLPQWDVSKHWLFFFVMLPRLKARVCVEGVCLTTETSPSASSTTTGVQMCACDPHTRTHTHTPHTHAHTYTHTHTHTPHAHTRTHAHTHTTHAHIHKHTHTHTHPHTPHTPRTHIHHTHAHTLAHTHTHTRTHTRTHARTHSHAHVLPSIDQLREPKDRRLNKPANSSIYLLLIKYSSVSYILIYFNFSCFDVFFSNYTNVNFNFYSFVF